MPATAETSAPAGAAPTDAQAPSFEAAMERLESIVEQMENARLPLEELICTYEEGTRLIKICAERLNVAEQRIEIITRDAAGQARVADYAPAANSSSSGSSNATSAAGTSIAPPKPVRDAVKPPASDSPTPAPTASRPSKTPNEVSLF